MTYSMGLMLDTLLPLLIAFAVTAVITWRLIPELKKVQTVQNIYEDAPESHQKKQGTPTMGGVAIICGILASGIYMLAVSGFDPDLLACMLVAAGFGLIGFIDDYTKIAKRRNKGLTARQKLALQIALSLAFAFYLLTMGEGGDFGSDIIVPFVWIDVDIGWLAIPYIVFILVAMTNAVNLTDGLDGLCAGSSATVSMFYPALLVGAGYSFIGRQFSRMGSELSSDYLLNPQGNTLILGEAGIGVQPQAGFFAAIAGACLGFLLFNRHPAKIFMGDTGSLALGGAIAAAAIWAKAELLLPIAGVLFVLEALSVIIQVSSYRLRHGKRVFKMAPLHHHFELSGWAETKVVGRFTAFTAVVCAALLAALIIQAYALGG
ncbi:MAG: phospho-N-acetylmuramoyl-pentapeptide-transferase [Clostridiales Family XIII bacterium]|jgi:phospho-N-acetylmuramoyl-pentapeptide-transferase|nr:phospho-N-acetylmuramoyl-pentapeptide-transferase [Clostridiales Family XIII bacterium]